MEALQDITGYKNCVLLGLSYSLHMCFKKRRHLVVRALTTDAEGPGFRCAECFNNIPCPHRREWVLVTFQS